MQTSASEPTSLPGPELGDPQPALPAYPDTPVGGLMRQRDAYIARAVNARTLAGQYNAVALENDTQASALQLAVDALSA